MLETDPTWLARKSPALGLRDHVRQIDMAGLRAYRLERVREQLRQRDYAAAVLFNPINIRYATGSRNMSVWTLHNAARYCFLPTEGPIILFDFHNCEHLSEGLETIAEVRGTTTSYFFAAGPRMAERAAKWAAEIADLVQLHGGGNRRLALAHCDPTGAAALARLGIEIHDAQAPLEMARAIKSPDEVALMSAAVAVTEAGIAAMREALRPGMTENALWALLHETNIRHGGEWIETRLLTSGGRTNPWFQECSERIIRPGDLVAFDTDLIGPFGYCADISRTFFCGPGRPSDEQRALYALAYEQIHYNMELLKPGLGFRELAETAWRIPNAYYGNRYSVVVHGVGMCDEYPHVGHLVEFTHALGYDGVFEAGMTVCVESYIGAPGGAEGVKLEQQVLITDRGLQLLSPYPFEEDLLE
jgi:Xaa-Pro aminopeptidase